MKTEHPDFGQHDQLKTLREAYGLTQIALANEIGVSTFYISLFERQRPVPEHASYDIQQWIESNI